MPPTIAPAVKRAFDLTKNNAAAHHAAAPSKPSGPAKGGLDMLFRTSFDIGLFNVVAQTDEAGSPLLAAATADGVLSFVDASDGRIVARCDSEDVEDPPNVMSFAGAQFLVACGDDAQCRTISVTGELVHAHSVTEPVADGKRPRVSSIDHMAVLGGVTYVAAAGRLVHCVSDGKLEHAHHAASPVRALCASPTREQHPSTASQWAYAIACAESVTLVSSAGEAVAQLSSKYTVRSLSAFGPWLAAAGMEGAIELWDVDGTAVDTPAYHTLRSNCGSDGYSLGWRADGGALAVGGRKAAVFDFTGENKPHPYRAKAGWAGWAARAGQPDLVPRICMANMGEGLGAPFVAWSPARPASNPAGAPSAEMATVDDMGGVQLWQPHGLPCRKGGVGDPAQPQRMKPQFYTFINHDAVHPSGEACKPCALVWLRGQAAVAVGYFSGEIVAWRVAGAM